MKCNDMISGFAVRRVIPVGELDGVLYRKATNLMALNLIKHIRFISELKKTMNFTKVRVVLALQSQL